MEQDDLEIISIGALYRGHWEKKYWSSSRGKDRYPYPVGYHASCIHAGSRCKMEIGEGPRGPLFMVGPADGDMCTGLTPDLAWESFYKKSTPKTKNWQGRRFSSKIDGAKLFGFKNEVVQRLLHQLIAASSRSPQEQISSSPEEQISSSRIKPDESLREHHTIEKTCLNNNDTHPNKIVCSRKRSVKQKTEERKAQKQHQEFLVDHIESPIGTGLTIKKSLATVADSKKENKGHEESSLVEEKDELEMKTCIAIVPEKHIISQENYSNLQDMPFEAENLQGSSADDDFLKIVPDSPVADDFLKIVPDSPVVDDFLKRVPDSPVVDDFLKIVPDSPVADDFLKRVPDSPVVDDFLKRVPDSPVVDDFLKIVPDSPVVDDFLKSVPDSPVVGDFLRIIPDSPVVDDLLKIVPDSPVVDDFSRIIPDSPVDDLLKIVPDSPVDTPNCSALKLGQPLAVESTPEDVSVDEVVKDSQTSSSANVSSQRTDQDLGKQDLAMSLMEFILPQAVPLLKERHTRKRFKNKYRKNATFSWDENDQPIEDDTKAMKQEPKEKTIGFTLLCEMVKTDPEHFDMPEEAACVIADSFEDNSNQNMNLSISSPGTIEGANLQNDVGELSDSFLAGLEEEFRAIENEAMLKKTNNKLDTGAPVRINIPVDKRLAVDIIESNYGGSIENWIDTSYMHCETLMDPTRSSEIPKGNAPSCSQSQVALSKNIIRQKFDETVLLEKKFNSFKPFLNAMEFELQVPEEVPGSNANQFIDLPLDNSHKNLTTFGPYEHLEPVLSLTLSSKDDFLEICVLCGELNTYERSLYIYNLVKGQPSFVGYTSMFNNSVVEVQPPSNENLPLGRAGLQYISEGGLLALIPSIRTPYCRKLRMNCSCSICKLEQGEENALKLVRVDFGFVVPVTKMKTNEKVSSILVCKPNYMIAIERTRLHVWIMSSTWRAISDEFTLSTLECMVPSILELEEVPTSNALVLGHDGFGAFCLWDISKRVLLAKFQVPNSTISKIIPLSCFSINKAMISNNNPNIKFCVRDISTNDPMQLGENFVAVWLLVSSSTVPECQTDLKAMNQRWRLALLAKDTLFMGHVLDPRISVLHASANFGFAGTHDGFYYKWDLNSGRKVAWMDCFSSGSVSCIAVDPKSGAVAVADENQVLICTQQN